MNEIDKIVELILGKKGCEQLITQIVKEYNEKGYNVNDFEYIMKSYFTAILIIGFSKKKVDIDKYCIHLINKPDINIDIKDFCNLYKDYINQVEKYKFDLLRKII